MKQKIEVKVSITLDYQDPELAQALAFKIENSGLTEEQIHAELHRMFVDGIKEVIEDEFESDYPGFSYSTEDITHENN